MRTKTHDCVEFYLYYFLPILICYKPFFEPMFWELLVQYVQIYQLLYSEIVYHDEIPKLYAEIYQFIMKSEKYMPETVFSIYFHSLIHYVKQMHFLGTILFLQLVLKFANV